MIRRQRGNHDNRNRRFIQCVEYNLNQGTDIANKMSYMLNQTTDVAVLANEYKHIRFQNNNEIMAFCSIFLVNILTKNDSYRMQCARLVCELLKVWSFPTPIENSPSNTQYYFFHTWCDTVQDAFESMNSTDNATSQRALSSLIGCLFTANVLSRITLHQIISQLFNNEDIDDLKIVRACHIIDACDTTLPIDLVKLYLSKLKEFLKLDDSDDSDDSDDDGESTIIDENTKDIAMSTVAKLKKRIEHENKQIPLCVAYTNLYEDLNTITEDILGQSRAALLIENEYLDDAVENPPNNKRAISIDTLIASLKDELDALRHENRFLEQEIDL